MVGVGINYCPRAGSALPLHEMFVSLTTKEGNVRTFCGEKERQGSPSGSLVSPIIFVS